MPRGDHTTRRPRIGHTPLCPSDISPVNGGNLVAGVRLPRSHEMAASVWLPRSHEMVASVWLPPLRGGNGAAKGGTFKRRCLEVIARRTVRASVISPLCPSDISPVNGGNRCCRAADCPARTKWLPHLSGCPRSRGKWRSQRGPRSNSDAWRWSHDLPSAHRSYPPFVLRTFPPRAGETVVAERRDRITFNSVC